MDNEKISTNEFGLLTTTEAAHYLGVKPSYLYKMMMRRAIPYYKPGGKLCFFAKADLDAWLTNIRIKSQSEIENEAARSISSAGKSTSKPIHKPLKNRSND